MTVEFINKDLPDIIELKKVTQTYDNGKIEVIKDMDLLIEDAPERGQFVVLLGPSGCGKSTVLRYIAGLQKPTSGEILLYGEARKDDDRIGMVFQQYSSFPWMTVRENVALGLKYRGVSKKERLEKADEMLQVVGLEGHGNKFAQYPTLDTNTRLRMQDFLIDIWEKVHPTIFFVTHDINEAVYLADDIFIMSRAPAKLAEHIHVNLPVHRDMSIKRDPNFTELVHYIEDKMMSL